MKCCYKYDFLPLSRTWDFCEPSEYQPILNYPLENLLKQFHLVQDIYTRGIFFKAETLETEENLPYFHVMNAWVCPKRFWKKAALVASFNLISFFRCK